MTTPSAEILKANRLFYGLTQREAAQLIHVSTKTWSQYEQDRRKIHEGFYELFIIKASKVAQLDK